MTVLLTDAEAADVASLLRRMTERIAESDQTPAYVDGRGPNDFAEQLEANVDADPSLYVPVTFGNGGVHVGRGHMSKIDASIEAVDGKTDVVEVPVADPQDE